MNLYYRKIERESLHEPASLHAQMLEPQTMSILEDIVSLFDMGRLHQTAQDLRTL